MKSCHFLTSTNLNQPNSNQCLHHTTGIHIAQWPHHFLLATKSSPSKKMHRKRSVFLGIYSSRETHLEVDMGWYEELQCPKKTTWDRIIICVFPTKFQSLPHKNTFKSFQTWEISAPKPQWTDTMTIAFHMHFIPFFLIFCSSLASQALKGFQWPDSSASHHCSPFDGPETMEGLQDSEIGARGCWGFWWIWGWYFGHDSFWVWL